MPRCGGSKADGTPCERIVGASQTYCFAHDPGRAGERRRNASKAGRGRPNREIVDLKVLLSDLTDRVLAGELETGRAAVANQLINTRLRAQEQERRQEEAGGRNLTPQELESFVATVVDIVGHHVPPERLRSVVEELGSFIDASG